MDFKQLESYAAVVRHRSFTRAADSLYLSQPTVSTHIRALEEELGTRLITRTTKSIQITPEGRKVYGYVEKLLEMRDRMKRDCAPSEKYILHLGASTIPSAYILPEILPEFSRREPNSFFVLHQSDSQAAAEGVAEGIYDLSLVGMPIVREDLVCRSFCTDRMVVIAPVTETFLSLQNQPQVPLQTLLRFPIILREKGSQKNADRLLEQLGIAEQSLTISARVNDPEAIKNLVAGGMGISIISERAARNFLREKRLLKFDLSPHSGTRELYLLYRKDREHLPAIQKFTAFLLEYYRKEKI